MDERLAAGETGLSVLQYGILQIIQKGPQTISEISRVQMLDPSTLVPAVDVLERNGLARRTKDPKDRRRSPLEITKEGQTLLASIPVLTDEDVLVKSLAQMSEAHQEQLRTLLRELVGKLNGEAAIQTLTAAIQAEMQVEAVTNSIDTDSSA